MPLVHITSREVILAAVEEFNSLGREGFLAKYKFGRARAYYLKIEEAYYDSKAILGVAHGIEHPNLGTLTAGDFSGGENTVAKKLESLGFTVVRFNGDFDPISSSPENPIILVENEVTAGGLYDDWKDVTGERYHYPHQYKNRIISGRPFVYYRGVRRLGGKSGTPEYFGCGTIGNIWRDAEISVDAPKHQWKWFCEIEDYEPFPYTVPAKLEGEYLENIPPNHWSVAVRLLDKAVYERIIKLSGVRDQLLGSKSAPPESIPLTDSVQPLIAIPGESLLLIAKHGHTLKSPQGGSRRSRHAKRIGDRAEEIVFKYLKEHLWGEEGESVTWRSKLLETPGWDIDYTNCAGDLIAVEVKGTSGPIFPAIEMTAREWNTAKEKGENYYLYLVANCLSTSPIIQAIQNPYAWYTASKLSAIPITWRLELLGQLT
jgi:Domain of unknown function (DUF3883)